MKYFIKGAKIKGKGGVTYELAQSFIDLFKTDSDFKYKKKSGENILKKALIKLLEGVEES